MVRVGVIGCGAISHSHLRSYAANEEAQIVAVADPIQAVAEARAQEYDTKAYTDYAAMLRSEELHAVSICTPPPSHREITEHAAARGLHVLCEKPLAMSVSEGEAMVAAAKQRKRHSDDRFLQPLLHADCEGQGVDRCRQAGPAAPLPPAIRGR